jgi:transcriptional regulator with XRE-family HTH domain
LSTASEENLRLALMLRAARNVLGLSLKQVGEQLGVTSAGAGKWESGISPIKASVFNQLDKFYRYHGVMMEIGSNGQPSVQISEKGLALLSKDPKKPQITQLSDIYIHEREASSRRSFMELAFQKEELKRLREKNPDMSERELEAALKAVMELKAEQWEAMIPSLHKWLQEEN